mmetsp:Transcript_89630/g.199210  ORF Transcript_89630/g.199210 Transcript_89630/m.199210 type:complete len:250 (-) Transcript_89630:22-771(-)
MTYRPSESSAVSNCTSVAACHAKPKVLMITPTTTAVARSCQTVIAVTSTTTKESSQLILVMSSNELHAKVFKAMRTMRPTSAATGMCAMMGAKMITQRQRTNPMTTPETRLCPPLPTLSKDCAMSAHPPWVPKKEEMMLPTPWPKHSRRVELVVWVIWSMSVCVMRLSKMPTIAKRTAVAMTLPHIAPSCQLTLLGGKFQAGQDLRPPAKVSCPATSSNVRASIWFLKMMLKTTVRIKEARGAGKAFPT